MKPRFKIGDILKFENDAIIIIFKVSRISIVKKTGNIHYITEEGKSYVECDGLELYQEQYKTPNAVISNSPCDPLLNIPTMTTNCPPNLLPNNLPRTWEDIGLCIKTMQIPYSIREIFDEIRSIEEHLKSKTLKIHIDLMKLLLLRDVYRINETSDSIFEEQVIVCDDKGIFTKRTLSGSSYKNTKPILSFRSAERRNLFFYNFKDLIERCKEFI